MSEERPGCRHCRFWAADTEYSSRYQPSVKWGECRRRAPRADGKVKRTNEHYWCGEQSDVRVPSTSTVQ